MNNGKFTIMDMQLLKANVPKDHKFITLSDKPRKGLASDAGFLVVEHYLTDVKQSRDKWRKLGR